MGSRSSKRGDQVIESPKRQGCLTVVLVLFGFGLAGGLLSSLQTGAGASTFELTALSPQCDETWGDRTRRKAARAGLLLGHSVEGSQIVGVVNPGLWQRVSLPGREALGLALACQVPDRFSAFTVRFRSDIAADDLMSLSPRDLYSLGTDRFVAEPTKPPPTGFRDLDWGSRRPPNLKAVSPGDDVFTSERAAPFLGLQPREEDYAFERGRLWAGDVYYDGPAAFEQLKRALFAQYGSPSSIWGDADSEVYEWTWKAPDRSVVLRYVPSKQTSWVHIAAP